MGRVRHNLCTAVGIILHPDEPEDNLSQPVRELKHPPVGVFVKPHGKELGQMCGPDAPAGCILVTPISAKVSIRLPTAMTIGTQVVTQVSIKRTAIPLANGMCVSDYFVQVRFKCERKRDLQVHYAQPQGHVLRTFV